MTIDLSSAIYNMYIYICMYISQFTKRGYDSYSIGAKIKNIKFKVNELDPNNGYLASGWTKLI